MVDIKMQEGEKIMKSCKDCVRYKDGFCNASEFNDSKHFIVDLETADICRLYKSK